MGIPKHSLLPFALGLALAGPGPALADGIRVVKPTQAGQPAPAEDLLAAAQAQDAAQVAAPLEGGTDANAKNRFGKSALAIAIGLGSIEIVTALVDAGASLETQGAKDHPLHDAAGAGRPDMIELLVARGADPAIPDRQGETLLEIAKTMGAEDVVAILTKAAGE